MRIYYNFRRWTLIMGLSLVGVVLNGQNYQEEMKLMRPKPGHTLLFGRVLYPDKTPVREAQISLFNSQESRIEERIPLDDFGAFLFSVKIEVLYGLIVEKEGYFPYFTAAKIDADYTDSNFELNITLGENLKRKMELVFQAMDTLLTAASDKRFEQLVDLLKEQNDLQVWFHAMGDSIDPIRINILSSNLVSNGIDAYRLIAGPRPLEAEKLIELTITTTETSTDTDASVSAMPGDHEWTIQILASKKQIEKSAFKGLEPVFEFKGKDGYYRYGYGRFTSKGKANSSLSKVKSKGFREAFAKSVESMNKL